MIFFRDFLNLLFSIKFNAACVRLLNLAHLSQICPLKFDYSCIQTAKNPSKTIAKNKPA
ncbi:MAG: hypothetical protein ACFN38_01550 [Campylobacter sp.]